MKSIHVQASNFNLRTQSVWIIIIIIIIVIATTTTTYLLTYLLQSCFHSVAVVLTLVQTQQIRINIHKWNNTKTQYKEYKTQ